MPNSILSSLLVFLLLGASLTGSSGQTVVPATKGQVDKLCAVLKSDASHKDKADACRLLSIIGTKDAVPTLAALLADEKLSHMARYGLETIPDPAVDEALLKALGNLQGRPLVGVIGSLGVRRVTRAVDPISKFLLHANADVAQAAARALGKIGNSAAAQALQAALPDAPAANQLAFCEGLFRCAEASLAQNQPAQAIAIYDALRQRKDPHQVRAGASRGAILARGQEGIPLIRLFLQNEDYILFSAAVQAAQEMSGPAVTKALTDGLDQQPGDRQILLLQTLGHRGDATALPNILQAAQQAEKEVRIAALNILGQLGDSSAVPVLITAALDPNGDIGKAARTTLVGLASDPKVDAAIMAMIEKGQTKARLVAIDVVAQRRARAANRALFKAANDPTQEIRVAALNALSQTGDTEDLEELIAVLSQRNNPDELRAAEDAVQSVCGKSADKPAAATMLLAALPKASVDPKCALLRLLRVTGGSDALQTVRTAAQDNNKQIQEAAIRTLCEWPSAEAAPDLLAMARSSQDDSRKIAALRGYINLVRDDNLSTAKKLAMAKEAAGLVKRSQEKKLLLGVLGSVPSSEALSMVMTHLGDSDTKNEASQAAVAISEKIIDQNPGDVVKAMEKVRDATNNNGLKRRANQLLSDAKKKDGQ